MLLSPRIIYEVLYHLVNVGHSLVQQQGSCKNYVLALVCVKAMRNALATGYAVSMQLHMYYNLDDTTISFNTFKRYRIHYP